MKNVKCLLLAVVSTVMFVPVILGQAKVPIPANDEILYLGFAKFENCDSVKVYFILSADKKIAKDYYFELYGIRVNYSKIETKQSGGATAEVKNGGMVYGDDKWKITVKQGLGAETVSGEFNYVYEHRQYNAQLYRDVVTLVDLGTAPVVFQRVLLGKPEPKWQDKSKPEPTQIADNDETTEPSIRCDGVYYRKASGYTEYLRFFEDGTVISMSAIWTIDQIKDYFNKSYDNTGKYEIVENKISFRTTNKFGSVDYNGQIYKNKLILNSHSLINGNRRDNVEFLFSTW